MALRHLITASALVLTIGAANADTIVEFDVAGTTSDGGTFSGTIGLDVTTPTNFASDNANIVSSDFPAKSFFDVFFDISVPSLPGVQVGISDGLGGTGDVLTLNIPTSSLTDAGGPIAGSFNQISITGGDITTPLPAALPLFATGLGAMGLLGWRRKRKSASAIAAT